MVGGQPPFVFEFVSRAVGNPSTMAAHTCRDPYIQRPVRTMMDSSAKITSKGQITIPKSVRDALELQEGDELLFRVERSRAVIAKTPSLLELAGSVAVPA